jgi:hypothetical protein
LAYSQICGKRSLYYSKNIKFLIIFENTKKLFCSWKIIFLK